MKTHTTFTDPVDSRLLAYGVEVDELLSMNNTETWTNELWTMFSGYMLAQKRIRLQSKH